MTKVNGTAVMVYKGLNWSCNAMYRAYKHNKTGLIYICLLLMVVGCGGGSNNSSDNQDEEINTENAQVAGLSIDFEDESPLNAWDTYSENRDTLSIDSTISYEGNQSLKISTEQQCIALTSVESMRVTAGEIYEVSIVVKAGAELNDCPIEFSTTVIQSDVELMHETSRGQIGENWQELTYYFQATTDMPFELGFTAGGYKDTWIDSINVTRWGTGAGENQALSFSEVFERESVLSEWYLTSNDSATLNLDSMQSSEGNSSLHVDGSRSVTLKRREYFAVTAGDVYELTFATKRSGSLLNVGRGFSLVLTQSGKEVLHHTIINEDADDWDIQKVYFQPESSIPVSLEILTGYERVWIDDMRFMLYSSNNITDPAVEEVHLSAGFEDESALDAWEVYSQDTSTVTLDDTTSYEGSRSLKISDNPCLGLSLIDHIPVTAGDIYEVSFMAKREGELSAGCSTELMTRINQGSEVMMDEYPRGLIGTDWTPQTYYFQADTDVPVDLALHVGYQSLWIDNLVVKRWDANASQEQNVREGFEEFSSFDDWYVSSDGTSSLILGDAGGYEGDSALQVAPEQCAKLKRREYFSVTAGESYEISFAVKRSGSHVGCANGFAVTLSQSGEEVVYEARDLQEGEIWQVETINFQAEKSVPVALDFFIGFERVWIDDLEIRRL